MSIILVSLTITFILIKFAYLRRFFRNLFLNSTLECVHYELKSLFDVGTTPSYC